MTKSIIESISLKKLEVAKRADAVWCSASDDVSIEEPLEIRLGFASPDQKDNPEESRTGHQNQTAQESPKRNGITAGTNCRKSDGAGADNQASDDTRVVAVTMRTPGSDDELAVGFLFTEGIITSARDIQSIHVGKCNAVKVFLHQHVKVDPTIFARHSFVASSCGVCGKKSIASVSVKRQYDCLPDTPRLSPDVLHSFPAKLRMHQSDFNKTGGTHASCLFDVNGEMLALREDVGRHNALDKLLGNQLFNETIPLTDKILAVSGRLSFELVQKAAHAGIPVVVAVGAPSSLAVQLAEECNVTLVGFVREERLNVYTGLQRIIGLTG